MLLEHGARPHMESHPASPIHEAVKRGNGRTVDWSHWKQDSCILYTAGPGESILLLERKRATFSASYTAVKPVGLAAETSFGTGNHITSSATPEDSRVVQGMEDRIKTHTSLSSRKRMDEMKVPSNVLPGTFVPHCPVMKLGQRTEMLRPNMGDWSYQVVTKDQYINQTINQAFPQLWHLPDHCFLCQIDEKIAKASLVKLKKTWGPCLTLFISIALAE